MVLDGTEQLPIAEHPESLIESSTKLVNTLIDERTSKRFRQRFEKKQDSIKGVFKTVKTLKNEGVFEGDGFTAVDWERWEIFSHGLIENYTHKALTYYLAPIRQDFADDWLEALIAGKENANALEKKWRNIDGYNTDRNTEREKSVRNISREVLDTGKHMEGIIFPKLREFRIGQRKEDLNRGIGYGLIAEEVSFDNAKVKLIGDKKLAFAIDAGVQNNEIVNEPNEDRILVVNNEYGTVLVGIDGIGGAGSGDVASQIFSEVAIEGIDKDLTSNSIVTQASTEMLEAGIRSGGVCFSIVRIKENELNVSRGGDVRMGIVRNGDVVFATKDQGTLNAVENPTIGFYASEVNEETFSLENGDVVFLVSDGITDQLTPTSYRDLEKNKQGRDLNQEAESANMQIAQVISETESPQEAIKKIGKLTWEKMKGDGHPDNRLLILYYN